MKDYLQETMTKATMSTIMTFVTLISTLIICFTSIEATNPLCAAVCECEDSEDEHSVKMDCSRVYLSIVPPLDDWLSNVTHMDLSSNNITALDTELAHPSVQILDLSHNHITFAAQSAFGGLNNLQYLNLANNAIKSFDENGFYGLNQLKSLNLSSNGLFNLPDRLFYNFVDLQELSLADNPLVHINPIHFNRMINLRWLDLSNTDVYSLQPNTFHTNGQLEFLDLSGNDFHEVPTDALRSAPKLKHLVLSENPIDFLNKKSFIKLKTLEVLELNNMGFLKDVQGETFSDLVNLCVLEMRYNRRLTTIDRLAFEGLFNKSRPVLQELDLEGNSLQKLDKDIVQCARMRKFNIQKNPWICDCTMKWLKHCQVQKIYAADLTCQAPEKVANAMIVYMNDEDFDCEYLMTAISDNIIHHEHVVRSISLGLAAGFLIVLAFGIGLVLKWKDLKTWYTKSRKGPGAVYYVRARANPREI